MIIFDRRFDVAGLLAWHRNQSNDGIAALVSRWVLPGEDAQAFGLRVAIRNGYLNLYVKGQSVAELRMFAGWPRLKVHAKYVACAANGSDEARIIGQRYKRILGEDIRDLNAGTIDDWIRTAETYAGDEKRFVDDVVAVTPGTIDLEMGLPADDDPDGKDRTAPRMDLVVAQGSDIAFWEAKCAVNGELRARASYSETQDFAYAEGPHVIWQLRRYERWVGQPKRREEVRTAYLEAARLLLELAEGFGKSGPAIDAWRALLAAGSSASVILPPGIVVADYCPTRADGLPREEGVAYASKTASFANHRQRLVDHGATIVSVPVKPIQPVLTLLTPGSIGDKEDCA